VCAGTGIPNDAICDTPALLYSRDQLAFTIRLKKPTLTLSFAASAVNSRLMSSSE
jgi:hypothetical protein